MKTSRIFHAFSNRAVRLCFTALFIPFFTALAQPFSDVPPSPESNGIVWNSTTTAVGQSAGSMYTPYSPFSPVSPSLQNGDNPVLYGPGGNPIGGLPISNGHWILLSLVLVYSIWRFFKRRETDKKLRIIIIMLMCSAFLPNALQAQTLEEDFAMLKEKYIAMGVPETMAIERATVVAKQLHDGIPYILRGSGHADGIQVAREHLNYTPEDYVRNIFINTGGGSCGTSGNVSNVKYTGIGWNQSTKTWENDFRPLAYFSHAECLGMDDGILLGTGPVNGAGTYNAEGPNSAYNGMSGGYPGNDSDLQALLNQGLVNSISILEFDFIPLQSEVSFDYIFASEEYPEYAHSQYNDVFGFFVSGPGISGSYTNQAINIAVLPDGTPVTINNVNNGYRNATNNPSDPLPDPVDRGPVHPEYYVANYSGVSCMEYDGRTVILTAKTTVIPGQQYHMKIAIANVGDSSWGSGVFLRAGSFDMGLGISNHVGETKNVNCAFEGCDHQKLSIGINPVATPTVVQLNYSGTALPYIKQLNGSNLPSSVTIPANTINYDIPYKVLSPLPSNNMTFKVTGEIDGCGEPMERTVTVYNKVKTTLTARPTCQNQNQGAVSYSFTGGSPSAKMSTDNGSTWKYLQTGTATGLPAGNFKVLVKDSVSCDILSSIAQVENISPIMRWSQTATDNNWNNPQNWRNADNQAYAAVPMNCVTVHIPGNASKYPSLDVTSSPRTSLYGEPVCDNIYFHFGAEVAKPHYLTYNKAFVDYNVGYFSGNTYKTDGDPYSAAAMNRDRWYALAAPLKKMVTGDFAMGGFPNTWQRGFKSSRDHSGVLSGGWYDPQETVALELGARLHYSISFYAPGYHSGVLGESDHMHLNNLKGIIQVPFFENPTLDNEHRLHTYMSGNKKSRFYYYNEHTAAMTIAYDKFDEIARENEAYRFVFENASNQPQENFIVKVPVVDKDGDSQIDEVMVGNPFISSLDFVKFFNDNSGKLENFYRLYSNGAFETYSIGVNPPPIASFQAVFIKPKGTMNSEASLTFTKDMSILRSGNHQLRSTNEMTDNLVKINVSNASGSSWLLLSFNPDINSNVSRLFSTDNPGIPQIYSLDAQGEKNTIQYIPGNTALRLGIMCNAQGNYELSFEGLDRLEVESLHLSDAVTNQVVNLFETPTYTFNANTGEDLEHRFRLHVGGVALGINDIVTDDAVNVYTVGNTFSVSSSIEIQEVAVFNLQGIRVWSKQPHQYHFSSELPLANGAYLVVVQLQNGDQKTNKIIIK